MDIIKTQSSILATQGHTTLLHVKDGLVEVALRRGEAAGDRPSACYISGVAAVLLLLLLETRIDEGVEILTPPASTRTISPSL